MSRSDVDVAHLVEVVEEWSHAIEWSTRPLLVGELNPYGSDPRRALAPLPPGAAGGRLCKVLGMSPKEYLKAFDRANLCVGDWDDDRARDRARSLLRSPRAGFVLLGAKVCRAFGVAFDPFTVSGDVGDRGIFVVLPHPSGRCRLWNDPASAERARELVRRAFQYTNKEERP